MCNNKKIFVQTKNLESIFDIKQDFFKKRMSKEFKKGKHYFIPPTDSKTKHIVLWDIEVVEQWLRSSNDEINMLLERC